MGCTGDREKGPPEYTQQWAFITLSDFKATSAWTSVAYMWLWFMALVAVAVYAADTFTAVNLIIFDKWNSQIQPAIPFKYSRWIFAACILLSWALCFYEWIRAIRVIKRGGVAQSYMDPLAVTLQSMRGQGWRRFLVFTELTKSKKGADYVAFFVYFGFNGAIRVILAEGPRQVINALSLYAVMKADLLDTSSTQHNAFEQFFLNIQALANKNEEQAVVLFSMLFTLIIWVFSALSLIFATILYLVFLWHYIPQRDGRLSIYCRRKIDRRLEKIVEHKVKAAIEEDERQKLRMEKKAELKRQKTGDLPQPGKPTMIRQPTLPQLGDSPELKSDEKMQEFGLSRQDTSTTVSTLPRYESRPPTRNGSQQLHRQPTLPDLGAGRPGMPSRMDTQGSAWSNAPSYESEAPLISNAGYGGGRESPAPQVPPQAAFNRQGSNASFGRPVPGRTMTQGSHSTQRSYTPVSRMDTVNSQQQRPFSPFSTQGSVQSRPPPEPRGPPLRSNTGFSFEDLQPAVTPVAAQDFYGRSMGPLARQNTPDTFRTAPVRQESQASSFSRPAYGSVHSQQSFSRPMIGGHQPRNPSQTSFNRPFSPPVAEAATSHQEAYEMTSQSSYSSSNSAAAPAPASDTGYVAFNPSLLSASNTPMPQLQQGPRRNITVAGQAGTANNYFGQVREVPQRSATAPIIDNRLTTGYADIFDDYGDSARNSIAPPAQEIRRPSPPSGGPPRARTAGPAGEGWQDHQQQNRF
ncbi:hypothetical protein LTR36_008973 [Oleoguttula mirabilis]|uniref:Pheromone-regulated membrane protein 6 n=1 Tax=Oleoguttula mirabilis TaxID=1507867 RepID=A0AAV9J714_9PEZI|nr:hypothetical protein LTR36_008973 [Oleoguttula mirabilis]